jgi:hypothetical protein
MNPFIHVNSIKYRKYQSTFYYYYYYYFFIDPIKFKPGYKFDSCSTESNNTIFTFHIFEILRI